MEIAKQLVKNSKVYNKFVAAEVDGELMDLSQKLQKDATVKFITFEDKQG
jgi:(p)ppGpp synthase/HD superfamily hydrolase